MTEVTINLPDKLAARIGASGVWLPFIIELGMTNFKNHGPTQAKVELIEFLSLNPDSKQVLEYFISDRLQKRLDYLLDLNGEGKANKSERQELNEWVKFDHITTMIKIQAAKIIRQEN